MKILQSVNSFQKNLLTQQFRYRSERAVNKLTFTSTVAQSMVISPKSGANVTVHSVQKLNKLTGRKQVHINIIEIKQPDLDAHLVGEGIARQLEQRVAFRNCTKTSNQRTKRAGI